MCENISLYYISLYYCVCSLVTHWCRVCLLRFLRDDLVVYGGQEVSLVSVPGRGSLFDTYDLLHCSLVQVGFTGQYSRDTNA